jgi:hypothetical protein
VAKPGAGSKSKAGTYVGITVYASTIFVKEFSFYFYFRLRTAEETEKKGMSDHSRDKAAAILQCSANKLSEIFFLAAYVFYFCKVPFVVNILRDPSVQYCTRKCLICFSLITGFPCRPYTIA